MPNNREQPKHYLRRKPILDEQILAAVKSAGGLGKFDEKGYYTTFSLAGFESYDEAHSYQQAVNRCAKYMSDKNRLPGGYKLSVSVKKTHLPDGTYKLDCMIFDKEHAKRYVDEHYGPNPEDKPYSPYRYKGHKNYNA